MPPTPRRRRGIVCTTPIPGEHFYTASDVEKDATVAAGWNYEGIGWHAPVTSETPVYRVYSGTDHHYTKDAGERDALVQLGWKDEGTSFYSDDQEAVYPSTGSSTPT